MYPVGGLGADNPDKAALDQLHAAALAIAAAKKAGDSVAEAAARQQFQQVASLYSGFTQAQLDTELAQASVLSDPIGLKSLGNGLLVAGVVAAVIYLLTSPKARAGLNWR